MAVAVDVVSFNIGTATAGNTVDVTGDLGGATCQAVEIFYNYRTEAVDTVGEKDMASGWGIGTGPTERRVQVCHFEIPVVATGADSGYGQSPNEIILSMPVGSPNSTNGKADIDAMIADGVRLIIDEQFANDLRCHAILYAGFDGAKVSTFIGSQSTGIQSVTGVGFQGDFIKLGTVTNNDDTGLGPNGAFLIGMAAGTGPTDQCVFAWTPGDRHDPTSCNSIGRDDAIVEMLEQGGSNSARRAQFAGFTADGFDIDWLETLAFDHAFNYLVLKGGLHKVDSIQTRTDGADIVSPSLGHAPAGIFFASCCRAEDASDTGTPDAEMSIGAAASISNRWAISSLSEDGLSTSSGGEAVEHDAVYARISDAEAIEGLMDVKAIGNDDFTCVMDDADPDAAFVGFHSVGNPGATVVSLPVAKMKFDAGGQISVSIQLPLAKMELVPQALIRPKALPVAKLLLSPQALTPPTPSSTGGITVVDNVDVIDDI